MKSWANTQRNSPGALPPMHPKRRGIFLAFLLSAVACWGATFGAFRGIGEGGTASPRGAGAGARPLHTLNMRGALPLCSPLERALRPAPRVTFVSRRKSPKACQGRCPWTPLGGIIIPPAARRAAPPPERVCGTSLAGFATLRWCGQLAFLSHEAPSGEHPLLSIRGAGAVA